jgi:hypothetical protein
MMSKKVKYVSLLLAGGALLWPGVAAVRADSADAGTSVSVQVADGGDTRIEVTRGGLNVRAGGVVLSWKKVMGARRYRLAVASDSAFAHKIVELEAADAAAAPVHLDAGTYYWRIAAVDAEGLEGTVTHARRFVIDTTPPRLKTGKPKWR